MNLSPTSIGTMLHLGRLPALGCVMSCIRASRAWTRSCRGRGHSRYHWAALQRPDRRLHDGAIAAELPGNFENACERGFIDSDLKKDRSPADNARMAGAFHYATGIRARLGVLAAELKAFTHSMIPVICL